MTNGQHDVQETLAGLGPRLRKLRMDHGLTLDELSERTGLPTSTLSRLETGSRKPSLEQLLPLAKIYGLGLDDLIQPEAPMDPRINLPSRRSGDGKIIWPLTNHASAVQAWKIQLPFGRRSPTMHTHDGREWFYVLEGRVRFILGGQDFELSPGEAVEFDTRTPHWFGAATPERTLILSLFSREGERIHLRGALE
ncbi:MAG: helix-turn-helix transcriptional regulator [Trueperella sp.]|nr:helix-turn-helix transcriptional regulator [Trueperella sp.]